MTHIYSQQDSRGHALVNHFYRLFYCVTVLSVILYCLELESKLCRSAVDSVDVEDVDETEFTVPGSHEFRHHRRRQCGVRASVGGADRRRYNINNYTRSTAFTKTAYVPVTYFCSIGTQCYGDVFFTYVTTYHDFVFFAFYSMFLFQWISRTR